MASKISERSKEEESRLATPFPRFPSFWQRWNLFPRRPVHPTMIPIKVELRKEPAAALAFGGYVPKAGLQKLPMIRSLSLLGLSANQSAVSAEKIANSDQSEAATERNTSVVFGERLDRLKSSPPGENKKRKGTSSHSCFSGKISQEEENVEEINNGSTGQKRNHHAGQLVEQPQLSNSRNKSQETGSVTSRETSTKKRLSLPRFFSLDRRKNRSSSSRYRDRNHPQPPDVIPDGDAAASANKMTSKPSSGFTLPRWFGGSKRSKSVENHLDRVSSSKTAKNNATFSAESATDVSAVRMRNRQLPPRPPEELSPQHRSSLCEPTYMNSAVSYASLHPIARPEVSAMPTPPSCEDILLARERLRKTRSCDPLAPSDDEPPLPLPLPSAPCLDDDPWNVSRSRSSFLGGDASDRGSFAASHNDGSFSSFRSRPASYSSSQPDLGPPRRGSHVALNPSLGHINEEGCCDSRGESVSPSAVSTEEDDDVFRSSDESSMRNQILGTPRSCTYPPYDREGGMPYEHFQSLTYEPTSISSSQHHGSNLLVKVT